MTLRPAWRAAAGLALLASLYLLYLPDAGFVLDDWWLFQRFERASGPAAMARAIVENRLWGSFRTNTLSFLAVYGLWGLAGRRPGIYFAAGVALHVLAAWLLCRLVRKLGFGEGTALAAGALFVVLPTAHNPLFWFPSCAHYLISAVWLLVYLGSAAGEWSPRAAAVQAGSAVLAFLSGDQAAGLLAGGALWMAVVLGRRELVRSAVVAWTAIAAAGGLYLGLVNRAPVGVTMAAKFDWSAARAGQNLREMASDYLRLAGAGGGYYTVAGIGLAAGLAAGLGVWWWTRGRAGSQAPRAAVLGLGWWALGYGPVLFLRWRELRYDYVPSLGLALALAALCRRPVMTAALAGWCAATVAAEARQCWRPQARITRAAARAVGQLENVRDHDIVAVAGTPDRIGTAPQFGMYLSYSSTPFVETATGVFGLIVGRDILYDSGRLGLEHKDFFRPLHEEDLARTHVVACLGEDCTAKTVLARELEPDRFELRALKNYRGPAFEAGRRYTRDEVHALGRQVYFAR